MPDPQRLQVSTAHAGMRADRYLARSLAISRGYAQRLLERECVHIRGLPARKGTLLSPGDVLDVKGFRHPSEGIRTDSDAMLRILAQSADLLAVDKPAGLPMHPLDYDARDTLANAVAALYPETRGVGFGPLEPGLLHRLDTQTSGVVLIARSHRAWREARRAFDDGSARKLYVARVHGRLEHALELELELAHRGDRMRVVEREGLRAHTCIRPLEIGTELTRVEIDLRTGVRHQIRASLAHLGHPIVGDAHYGSPTPLPRHLLHAWRIELGDFAAEAPLPDELAGEPELSSGPEPEPR